MFRRVDARGRDFKRLYDVLDSDLDLGIKISTCVFFFYVDLGFVGYEKKILSL